MSLKFDKLICNSGQWFVHLQCLSTSSQWPLTVRFNYPLFNVCWSLKVSQGVWRRADIGDKSIEKQDVIGAEISAVLVIEPPWVSLARWQGQFAVPQAALIDDHQPGARRRMNDRGKQTIESASTVTSSRHQERRPLDESETARMSFRRPYEKVFAAGDHDSTFKSVSGSRSCLARAESGACRGITSSLQHVLPRSMRWRTRSMMGHQVCSSPYHFQSIFHPLLFAFPLCLISSCNLYLSCIPPYLSVCFSFSISG